MSGGWAQEEGEKEGKRREGGERDKRGRVKLSGGEGGAWTA